MTPLRVAVTDCPSSDPDTHPSHGVIITLDVRESVYAVECYMFYLTLDQVPIPFPISHVQYRDLMDATDWFDSLAHYYDCTHELNDDEIESRTHGRYR